MSVLTILCGGKSRRMETDKALLEFQGETLLQRHSRLAREMDLQIQIAGGDKKYDLPTPVIWIEDKLPDQAGPLSALAGALTAAASTGKEGTWLMPVDTLITPQQLIATLQEKRPAPVVMVIRDGRPQPLLAWYSTALLPRVEEWLSTGIRHMMPLAAVSEICHVVMPPEWVGLDNFNTPEEWQTAQALVKEGKTE